LKLKVLMTAFLKRYAPFVIASGRAVKKLFKRRALEKKRKRKEIVTGEMLLRDLEEMGIRKGDSVMVHISLSKVGFVEGGAATVVDALMKAVGTEGNLLMPAFAHDTFGKYYLDSDPVFDIVNSPSRAGAVTEAFRKRKGVLRSFHPTDSVCAYGPLAAYFTEGHFGQLTPYNEHSPYCRLTEKNGKILNIGVPLNTSCTNMHTLEDAVAFRFPVYFPKVYEVKMKDEKGEIRIMRTKVHDPAFSKKRLPDEQIPMFEKDGALRHGKFGEAAVMIVDAKKLFASMMKNYTERGVTMYTPHGSI
jgi:aminoglycoside 3-N-acetyltransferase